MFISLETENFTSEHMDSFYSGHGSRKTCLRLKCSYGSSGGGGVTAAQVALISLPDPFFFNIIVKKNKKSIH